MGINNSGGNMVLSGVRDTEWLKNSGILTCDRLSVQLDFQNSGIFRANQLIINGDFRNSGALIVPEIQVFGNMKNSGRIDVRKLTVHGQVKDSGSIFGSILNGTGLPEPRVTNKISSGLETGLDTSDSHSSSQQKISFGGADDEGVKIKAQKDMRLICPNCSVQYEVSDDVIPLGGRDVQCANCGDTWFQSHPENPISESTSEASIERPAMAGMSNRPVGTPDKELKRRREALNAAKAREAEDAVRRESARKSGSDGKKPPVLREGVGVQNTKQTFRQGRTKSVIVNTKRKRVVVPAPGRSVKAEGASSCSAGIPDEEMERRREALNAAKNRESEATSREAFVEKSGSEKNPPPDGNDLTIHRPLVAPERHYDNKPMVETGRKRVVTPARGGTKKATGPTSDHTTRISGEEVERRHEALSAAKARGPKNPSHRDSAEKSGREEKQVSDNQSQKRLDSKTKQNEQPYPGYLESQQGGAVALSELYGAMLEYSDGVLSGRIFDPRKGEDDPTGLLFAISVLRDAVHAPPENLLPLMPVCENSFACAICDRDISDENSREAYEVVRWHLGLVDERAQGEVLDVDALSFLNSMADELNNREAERKKLDRTSERYYNEYVVKGRRPSVGQLRPVQLACQNVIIGLASLRHDPVFDGLRVEAYASCEAPHLATGEADRAMAGLLLCDAFQSGGTMEVRFGTTRKEMHVPPALRRFARVRGLTLGANDRCSISPAEARELFLAVTPMSDELRVRTFEAFDGGIITPERLCYTLMAGVWSQIELGYFLATTARTASILVGGADYTDRLTRSAEQEICRAALMSGMLLRRLENASDNEDQASGVDVIEDQRVGTEWAIRSEIGAVAYEVQSGQPLPWITKPYGSEDTSDNHDTLIVVSRGMPLSCDFELIHTLKEEMPDASVKLLVPADADLGSFSEEMSLRCPWSLAELDQETRRRLDKLRIARK